MTGIPQRRPSTTSIVPRLAGRPELMKTNRGDDARARAAAVVTSPQTPIGRLNVAGDLTADEKRELAAMPLRVELLERGQFLLRQGTRASYCC